RDAVYYHLFLPKIYLKESRIITMPENIYSYFPAYWCLFCSFVLAISDDIIPKLIQALFLVLNIFLIKDIAKALAPDIKPFYGLTAGLIFLTAPTVTKTAGWAYLDTGLTFYCLLSLYGLIKFYDEKENIFYYLSAVAMGFALGMKYSAFLWFICLGLFILEGEGKIGRFFINYLKWALVAFVIASPFYLRNYLVAKNPFFPFFYDMFGSNNLGLEKFDLIMLYFKSYGEGTDFKSLALLPYRIFFESDFAVAKRFDGKISLLFMLAVAGIFRIKRIIKFKSLIYIPVIYALLWFIMSQQIRFLMPVLGLISVISGIYLMKLDKKIANCIVMAAGVLYLYYPLTDFLAVKPYRFFLYKENRPEFLSRNIKIYPVFEYINENLPLNSKIMLLNVGPAGYYIDRAVYQESIFEDYTFTQRLSVSRQELLSFLKKENIGYLLTDEAFLKTYLTPRLSANQAKNFKEFRLNNLLPLYRYGSLVLYEIIST
ncbi:MAG: glycosyltransferase family 39 protein, partial [Candidatus Omnitrophica bacterium]|nr:glycosyltransferase family 39 protein [Candidatus Omnitrophota bacterium]